MHNEPDRLRRTSVSVIGVGRMGSALARAFLAGGATATIYDTDASHLLPLVEEGANAASSFAEAVTASPVVVLSLRGYDTATGALSPSDVSSLLAGKVLVQLSSGTPKEAAQLSELADRWSILYLDGVVHVSPSAIGTERAAITYGGSREAFDRCLPLLRCLSPQTVFAGENPCVANVLASCENMLGYAAVLGYLQACAIASAYEISLLSLLERSREVTLPQVGREFEYLTEDIANHRLGGGEATLNGHLDSLGQVLDLSEDLGLSTRLPQAMVDLAREAIAGGHGADDLAAVFQSILAG